MARNESVPLWDHADTLTALTTAAVRGKRFVAVQAGGRESGAFGPGRIRVAEAAAGGTKVLGIACYDAASGAGVTVHHARTIIAPVTAGAAVAAGDLVTSDAEGRAVPFTGQAGAVALGIALDAAATGADVPVDRTITG